MKIRKTLCLVISVLLLISLVSPAYVFADGEEWYEEPIEELYEEPIEEWYEEPVDEWYEEPNDDSFNGFLNDSSIDYQDENTVISLADDQTEGNTVNNEIIAEEFIVEDTETFSTSNDTPVITAQPEPFEGAVGETATFTVAATGTGTLKYQWQWSSDGNTWVNAGLTGNKTDTLTVPITEARNGYQYRCVVTDGNGKTTTSNGAQLSIVGDFVFENIDSSTARLIKYNGSDSNVTVDAEYNGKTVTEIGPSAFENNTIITSVKLPNSITIIGKRAFAGCTNLSSMTTY